MRAVELFGLLRSQWRMVAGFGVLAHLGLDYAAVEAVFRIRAIPRRDRAELLDDLRVMEGAYMEERAKASRG